MRRITPEVVLWAAQKESDSKRHDMQFVCYAVFLRA